MKTLHITSGNTLTALLKEQDYSGEFLTWQEMLCEGPTAEIIDSDEFFAVRRQFLQDFYDIEVNEEEFRKEIGILDHLEAFDQIVLWFQYDLFCHINLMAVISMLSQKNVQLPLYLVCSGRVEGEKELKGLSELKPAQLKTQFNLKIKLSKQDVELMKSLWKTYCGTDHNLFKPHIVQKTSFLYLGSCLKAHLQRFPDSKTGLSVLEQNIVSIIEKYPINSRQHLLGYALNYQGYYGFVDIQLIRKIEKLSILYNENDKGITLNNKGKEAILGHYNFSSEIDNNMPLGGVNKLDFQFDKEQNQLIKTL